MKAVAIGLASLVLVMLVGCSSGEADPGLSVPGLRTYANYVDLPDGRRVLCVFQRVQNNTGSGGPSCDWSSAK